MAIQTICLVPGCGRICQTYAKAGMFGGKQQYLKTCGRHSITDLLGPDYKAIDQIDKLKDNQLSK
jgi:hypothetical protein